MPSRVVQIHSGFEHLARWLTTILQSQFLAPGSTSSLESLLCALAVAVVFLACRRRGRGRPLRARVLVRALFPRRLIESASTKADAGFLVFNIFMAGALFGWALLSSHQICLLTDGLLRRTFGAPRWGALGGLPGQAIMTLGLFLAYELGYWIDHYLKHRVPILWAFHKVHHTAEVLSPMTNFRVHPVDSVIFLNIVALVTGLAQGALGYGLGQAAQPLSMAGTNAIFLLFLFLMVHLQHSHIWMAATGFWGRVILSPAHHQIHHSSDPAHFNRNFGSCLSVWDWVFGTLHVPARSRERLTFGVEGVTGDPHGVTGGLITPFVEAVVVTWTAIRALISGGKPDFSQDDAPDGSNAGDGVAAVKAALAG
jgi:sterol desaturase/sphingolipid hydroxylase (fatty acid hydroxylase superfamily)